MFCDEIASDPLFKPRNCSLAQPQARFKLGLLALPSWWARLDMNVDSEVDKDELNCNSCKSFEPLESIKTTLRAPRTAVTTFHGLLISFCEHLSLKNVCHNNITFSLTWVSLVTFFWETCSPVWGFVSYTIYWIEHFQLQCHI